MKDGLKPMLLGSIERPMLIRKGNGSDVKFAAKIESKRVGE